MSSVIIGIHGLSNKPGPEVLAKGWENAILEGMRRNAIIPRPSVNFHSVYWADVMYDEYDANPDLYHEAPPGELKRYKDHWMDHLWAQVLDFGGDVIDGMKKLFGMDRTADGVLEKKLKDLYQYYGDKGKRETLRGRLKAAVKEHRNKRIMVVAHSMGSIVAYDALRELGREDPTLSVGHLVTIGSPLGMPHVKYKIMQESPLVRTPSIVKRWSNQVLFQCDNDGFRAPQNRQCKAQLAGNGRPLSRAATPQWRFCGAPCGRGEQRPSAVLLALEVGWLPRRASALQLTAARHAEPVIITLKEY